MSTYWMLKCLPCDKVSESAGKHVGAEIDGLIKMLPDLMKAIKHPDAPDSFEVSITYGRDDFFSFACSHYGEGHQLVSWNEYGESWTGYLRSRAAR